VAHRVLLARAAHAHKRARARRPPRARGYGYGYDCGSRSRSTHGSGYASRPAGARRRAPSRTAVMRMRWLGSEVYGSSLEVTCQCSMQDCEPQKGVRAHWRRRRVPSRGVVR
jgi:hypothetical protein